MYVRNTIAEYFYSRLEKNSIEKKNDESKRKNIKREKKKLIK